MVVEGWLKGGLMVVEWWLNGGFLAMSRTCGRCLYRFCRSKTGLIHQGKLAVASSCAALWRLWSWVLTWLQWNVFVPRKHMEKRMNSHWNGDSTISTIVRKLEIQPSIWPRDPEVRTHDHGYPPGFSRELEAHQRTSSECIHIKRCRDVEVELHSVYSISNNTYRKS